MNLTRLFRRRHRVTTKKTNAYTVPTDPEYRKKLHCCGKRDDAVRCVCDDMGRDNNNIQAVVIILIVAAAAAVLKVVEEDQEMMIAMKIVDGRAGGRARGVWQKRRQSLILLQTIGSTI